MHLGIIGFGSIGTALLGLLPNAPVRRVTVLVRPGARDAARERVAEEGGRLPVDVVTTVEALIAAGPELVVECAGHGAVAAYGPALLGAGRDLVIVSVGALADAALQTTLEEAAAGPGAGRMIFPIGAIGGIDLLSTLAPAGELEVRYRGTKPPAAWKGTPAEATLALDNLSEPARFFDGTAREAAQTFPKNANVVAALALAGAGFEATRVELVADPSAAGNRHAYEVVSPLCRYSMEITANATPGTARTSATTAWSVLAEIRSYAAARGIT
jgi:aspartate dehydrogenase